MNLPTKLTVSRIIATFIVIIILIFPFYSIGFQWPQFKVGTIIISLQYIVAGIIFVLASITDFVDGYLARKNNQVTDLGKMLDAIADKILVNSVLIILAYKGMLPIIVPVVTVLRDTFVYNLPFELIPINVSDFLLLIATVLSVVSGIQYYLLNKELLFANE